MRASIQLPDLPPQFEIFQPPRSAANDGYAEIMLGGLKTACLTRDEMARLMLADCLEARRREVHPPKLVFASNGHAIALSARDARFRDTFAQAGVDALELSTDDDVADAVLRFADMRKHRAKLNAGAAP